MSSNSIYQIVHTLGGTIYHLEAHLKLLFEAYFELFSSYIELDQSDIERQIKETIERSHCPKDISLFVRISLSAQGKLLIEEYERSLYCGYAIRSISPTAALVDFNLPYATYPTTIRSQLTEFANHAARKQGCEVALRCCGNIVDMVNCAQIFGLNDQGIFTAADSYSVEHQATKEAVRALGLNLIEGVITVEQLASFDELFYVDHNGITAIRSCNNNYYMSLTAPSLITKLHGHPRRNIV